MSPAAGSLRSILQVGVLSLLILSAGACSRGIEDRELKPRMVLLSDGGAAVHAEHPSWDNASCNAIAEGDVRLFMNKDQVRAAWGEPSRIQVRVDSQSVSKETWVYSSTHSVTFNVIDRVEAFEYRKE